jgi:hypothetical protein
VNQPSLVTTLPLARPSSHRGICPFAANCACVFARSEPATSFDVATKNAGSPREILNTAVADWTDRGFQVTSDAGYVVELTRPKPSSFCANAFLVAFTGLLWIIALVVRARRPQVEVVRLTVSGDGELATDRSLARR